MKKIFLLLVLFNSLIFSNADGFLDLKWGASKDETLKYMNKTFGVTTNVIEDDVILYSMKNIKFEGLDLKDLYFSYLPNGKFNMWIGKTYTIKGDQTKIKKTLKEKYGLKEEKKEKYDRLFNYINGEAIEIKFYNDRIEFYLENYNLTLE